MMKKCALTVLASMGLLAVLGGCASKGDLENVQAKNMEIGAKADQAALDAQTAKAAADEALLRVNEAIAKAEAAERRALERERIAEEKIRQADAAFTNSMKK
jgi:murein lipoprotein